MSVLVIAAHPDDEVLGCGGAMARFAGEGRDVFAAILGEGITSRHDRRAEADADALRSLQQNSRRAAELLGVKELRTFDLPDNRFDTVPLLEVAKIIEELVEEFRPQTVFTQSGGDLNIDHQIAYQATMIATRPMEDTAVKALYSYEVPSSTDWSFGKFAPAFRPNVFVDISDTLEKKVEAMSMYESEARPFPHPRSAESLRAAALRWGSIAGLRAAEAFDLVRWIR